MPDRLDMPDWRNPADGSVMRWDPTSQRYVKGEDYDGDQPTEYSGVGQTLDPAKDRLKAKNPEQTGIMASWVPHEGDEVTYRGVGGAGSPQDGALGVVLRVRDAMDSRGPLALVKFDMHQTWMPTSALVPSDDVSDRMTAPVEWQQHGHDTPEQVENLVRSAAFDMDRTDMPNFHPGDRVVSDRDDSTHGQKGYIVEPSEGHEDGPWWSVQWDGTDWTEEVPERTISLLAPEQVPDHAPWDERSIKPELQRDTPEQQHDMVTHANAITALQCPYCGGQPAPDGVCGRCGKPVMNSAAPQPSHPQADMGTFNEVVPKPSVTQTDRSFPSLASRAFPEDESSWQHNLAAADLDSCPECSSSMIEGPHGAKCSSCGLKQPAVKIAFLPLLAAGAARLLAPLAMRAGVGAVAGEAATGEAAAAGGLEATNPGLMSAVGRTMGQAARVVGPMGGQQQQTPVTGPAAPTAVPYEKPMTIGHVSSNESWQVQFVQRGDSDNPEHDGTRGFQEEHSDAPEFLKDVNGIGGTKTEGDVPDWPKDFPEDWANELSDMDDHQLHALNELGNNLDHIIVLSDDDTKDGSSDDIFKKIDELLEKAFPGYRADKKEKKESSMDHEMLEKVAARRPKLCPAHGDLIDASLLEGKSLLGQFAPSNYGSNYCKSPDFDGKCNFKPAMTTQKFWDDKDEQAAQRKIEREQAAEQQRADELAGTTLDPTEHDVDFGDAPVAETSEPAGEYAPGLTEAPSAVAQPVAASVKEATLGVGTAVRRKSLSPRHDDPVGIIVALTTVHDSSPGRATVRFEDGNEEDVPMSELEPADGGGLGHPTMDHAMDAPHPFEDEMDAPVGGYSVPAGDMPYSYASVKEAEHDVSDAGHGEDADEYDFGHGLPTKQPDSAVAQDDQDGIAGIKDVNGSPLKEGSTYLMKSVDYTVPDRVTIDKVAGPDITYTIHAGDMDFQDKLSAADIELQGFTFEPEAGADMSEGSPDEMADDVPAPTVHQHADDSGEVKAASRAEGCACDEDLCECEGDKSEKTASVNLDAFFMWHAPEMNKTAGKDYSHSELRDLINEGEGKLARNYDSLQIDDVPHYVEFLNQQGDVSSDEWLW